MTAIKHTEAYAYESWFFRDYTFSMPLDHNAPNGEQIEVFAREVNARGKEDSQLPWLIFFQGGPGFPSAESYRSAWVKRLTEEYRVLLLDQRGTGPSSTILAQTLAGKSDQEMANYLTHFRADSIVKDADAIRKLLEAGDRWTLAGQSFGGFCILAYLSHFPQSVENYLITGGLAGIDRSVDEIYRMTYLQLANENKRFFQLFPKDRQKVNAVVNHLRNHEVKLPSGDPLTVEKFQLLGAAFGGASGFEAMHRLLANPFVQGINGPELSYPFLKQVEAMLPFDTNPIYAILHESIYADGYATNWSAERVREEYPIFDSTADEIQFTGEMVYPWMFDQFSQLQPLKGAAQILAEKADWGKLYDREKMISAEVTGAAAVYFSDMYVPVNYSIEVASRHLYDCRPWVTNEFKHSGIGEDGQRVMDRLLGLMTGKITCNYPY